MSIPSVWILLSAAAAFLAFAHLLPPAQSETSSLESAVLTLDASNFTDAIANHPFLLVNFYAPWCGHCKELAPEYEKAALILHDHDAPIVLAKVDASDDTNRDIASKYHVQGFPTLKIFKNEGKDIQEYNGPDEADGIVGYLKKQLGPASIEIKSKEDVNSLFNDKKIFIAGIFPEYSGEEFENFMLVAEKLRSDYDFGHTLDSKLLPRGDQIEDRPVVRLFKPFDELFVDSQDFHVDAIEKFIEESSISVMTIFNDDPDNRPFLLKFFNHPNAKAMLFVNFTSEHFDAFMSKHHEVAKHYKGTNISFLIGDVDISKAAFEYFGLNEDQVPLILIEEEDGKKYLKQNLEPEHIQAWIQDYKDGKLTPFRKSEPIPEANDEPVKVVVAESIQDVFFKSRKNVFLELYAPWCGHCKKLALVLDEVAISFKDDANVIIAKMDATKNDAPPEIKVHGYPTLYFSSASGKLVQYDGGRKAEDIIDFIQKNSDPITTATTDSVKDEL